jgi:hypothetical protein
MKNDKIPEGGKVKGTPINYTEITIKDKDSLGAYLKAKAQVTDQGGVGKAVVPAPQKKSYSGSVSRFASKKLKGEEVSSPAKSKKG